MSRSSIRGLAVACVGALLTACGGGNDGPAAPPPSPSASIAIGAPTATLLAGATTTVTITLTRSGGFAGAVTVTATGLPTGVTSSSATIAAGTTTGSITLTAASTAPAAAAVSASVTATGSGVTIAAQPLGVSVTALATNGATIALGSAAGSIENGRSGTIAVTVTRTGTFTGAVTIAAASLPSGVTVANQTIAAGATTATLTITSNLGVAAGTTTLKVNGTGSGITIASQDYALTVTAGPITVPGNDITNADAQFAGKMALSADGSRIVIGASGSLNGTTRVYERSGSTWSQLGGDIVGEAADDQAGIGVAINAAGTRIAVGASQNDGGGNGSGHVRVYDLVGRTWTQVGADLDGDANGWALGTTVALSGSGNRLIAGAPFTGGSNGRAKVYELVSGAWVQLGNTLAGGSDEYADAVDISSDGTTVAVSSPSGGSSRPGSVQVYRLVGATWTQLGNALQGEANADGFGDAVSLSVSGSRIAVSAPADREGGVSGGGAAAGKVRVFDLVGGTWTQVGADILGNVGLNGENLGETLVMSDDGTRVAATGTSQSIAKVYTLSAGAWVQTGPDIVGYGAAARSEGLALSADGKAVAVGYVNALPRIARVFRVTP